MISTQAVGGAPLTKVARKQKALGFLRRDRPCGVPPPGPVTAHAPNCVEINQWNAPSSENFKPLELGHIEVDSADFWTDRLLSASSRSTVEALVSKLSHTRTLKSG